MNKKLFCAEVTKDEEFQVEDIVRKENRKFKIKNPNENDIKDFFEWILSGIINKKLSQDIEIGCDYVKNGRGSIYEELLEKFANKLDSEVKKIFEKDKEITDLNG